MQLTPLSLYRIQREAGSPFPPASLSRSWRIPTARLPRASERALAPLPSPVSSDTRPVLQESGPGKDPMGGTNEGQRKQTCRPRQQQAEPTQDSWWGQAVGESLQPTHCGTDFRSCVTREKPEQEDVLGQTRTTLNKIRSQINPAETLWVSGRRGNG